MLKNKNIFITGIGKEARDAAKGVKQLAESTDLVKSRFEGLSDVSQEAALKQFARAAGKNLRTITRDIRAFEKDLERLNAGGFARFIRFSVFGSEKLYFCDSITWKITSLITSSNCEKEITK